MDRPEEDVLEAFESISELYGISPSHGRIYGILYFSDEALTLDELSERSGFAKSTVSNAVNNFENLNLIERRPSNDSTRKVFFEAREDFEQIMEELITEKFEEEIDIMLEAIKESKSKVDKEEIPEKFDKLEKLEDNYRRGRKYVKLFKSVNPAKLRKLKGKVPGLSGKDS